MTDRLIDLLAQDLADADFTLASIEALLGEPAERARQGGSVFAARRVLDSRKGSPLATLVRLFLLGDEVGREVADAALPGLRCEGLVELDLAVSSATGVRATKSVNAVSIADDVAGVEGAAPEGDADGSAQGTHDWWIVSDLDDHLRDGPARTDHVMGVGGATRSLIAQLAPSITLSAAGGAALDLGTGCGIVALHLALRTSRVVATDISARALDVARLNARLNGLSDRIEFRRGSLFEPVAGETFALIASNPPFVITPRLENEPVYEYRDGGRAGDELAAAVVREGVHYLSDDGTLVCLANWEYPWGGNGLERVRGWISGAEVPGLAAWVIERDRLDPLGYAQMWARDGGEQPGTPGHDRKLAAWLDDFDLRRVVSIGLGSIRISRTNNDDQTPLVHLEQATGAIATQHTGRSFAAAFAAGTMAARMSDAEVLATHWLRDDLATEHREHEPGAESPRSISLSTEQPIARVVAADPLLAAALGACDGDLSLAQIADALATILEVDAEAASQALVASARELTWLGMLTAQTTAQA